MNIQPNITKTTAEEALLLALAEMDTPTASQAAEHIATKGLPTRRVEAWHYTDLRTLLKNFPKAPSAIQSEFASEGIEEMSDLIDAYTIGFSNSFHVRGFLKNLPQGASATVGGVSTPIPANVSISADTIGMINEALQENGVNINVAPKANVESPIALAHTCAGETSSILRHAISVGAQATATFIEHHHSSTIANHQNVVCNLSVGKAAKVTWVILQELGEETTRLGQLNVHLADDAELTILVLNAGGKLVRQEIHIAVQGENSNLDIKGVNLIGEGAHIDVTTSLAHNVPNTNATELFRNVVTGRGKGVFQGQIRVAQAAQKTDAKMSCNTLLLSDESDFSAKPELEIFADDVLCGHGATVTDIDENHLFYLRARGISEREARALLVKAFVEEVFEDLEIGPHGETIGSALNQQIENWLDTNA